MVPTPTRVAKALTATYISIAQCVRWLVPVVLAVVVQEVAVQEMVVLVVVVLLMAVLVADVLIVVGWSPRLRWLWLRWTW